MRRSRKLIGIILLMTMLVCSLIGCGSKKTLEDGTYQVSVSMEGGTGKASIDSPTTLEVKDGEATVTLVWSSQYYDYMIVDGITYENEAESGQPSTFTIPLKDSFVLGESFEVIGDTTAMSQPHEITYQLTLDLVE